MQRSKKTTQDDIPLSSLFTHPVNIELIFTCLQDEKHASARADDSRAFLSGQPQRALVVNDTDESTAVFGDTSLTLKITQKCNLDMSECRSCVTCSLFFLKVSRLSHPLLSVGRMIFAVDLGQQMRHPLLSPSSPPSPVLRFVCFALLPPHLSALSLRTGFDHTPCVIL